MDLTQKKMVKFNFDMDGDENEPYYAWCPYKCGKILRMTGDNLYMCDYCDCEFEIKEKDDGIFFDDDEDEDES